MKIFNVGLAAIALVTPLGGLAQSPSEPPKATSQDAVIAASPAARRLYEVVDVVNRGDEAIRAYAASSAVPAKGRQEGPSGPAPPLLSLLEARYFSHGYEFVRFEAASPNEVRAILRNKLMDELQTVILEVEPAPPHRIVTIDRGPAPAQRLREKTSDDQRIADVAAFVERLADADAFSGVVLIAKNGKPLFRRSYGFADRERRIPHRFDTRFRLASLSKIFTGLAIGRLVEQGKLSYEDPLSNFIPDFPDPESAKKVRIKHLLSHTSGLGNYFNQSFFDNIDKMVDVKSILAAVETQPLRFEPGSAVRYSNTGLLLLGRIIEIVTGDDYYAHMDKTMFKPLGLTRTGFPRYDEVGPETALPYQISLTADERAELALAQTVVKRGAPSGDAASTAPDLLRFANALQSGLIVKPETLRLHSTAKPELNAPRFGYAMLLSPRVPGRDIFGHSGDAPGTCTELGMIRDMPSSYTVVVLSNGSAGHCHAVVRRIYRNFAPSDAKAEVASVRISALVP